MRIPWMVMRMNQSILTKIGVRIRLLTICRQHVLKYTFGHLARCESDNLEKLVMVGNVEGKRPRGRSPTRWSDQFREATQSNLEAALHIGADRE